MTARQAWQGLRWYVREVSGETAYQRYLERHRSEHPDRPALDERSFWRQRVDGKEGEPPQRCC